MSLLSKVKKRLQEQREKGREEKAERKIVEDEAKAQARKEYLQTYRRDRISTLKSQAHKKAKHDASKTGGGSFSLGGIGTALGKAGKNFSESGQLDFGIGQPTKKGKQSENQFDLGFGTPAKKKGKKKKEFNPWTM
jgi:hypothetical protein